MRDYFQEQLPEFRTPRVHNAICTAQDGTNRVISMWVCSKDNSMDQAKWYFAVQVEHLGGERQGKTATHFFLDERDAWIFRAKHLNCPRVQILTDYKRVMHQMGPRIEGAIVEPDFSERTYWEGYLAAEVLNVVD